MKNRLLKTNIQANLNNAIHQHNTRNEDGFHREQYLSNYVKWGPNKDATIKFNELPKKKRDVKNTSKFKKQIKFI